MNRIEMRDRVTENQVRLIRLNKSKLAANDAWASLRG